MLNRAGKAHQHRQVYDLADYPQFTQLTISLHEGGPVSLALVPTAPAIPLPLDATQPLTVALAALPGTHLLAYNDTGKATRLAGRWQPGPAPPLPIVAAGAFWWGRCRCSASA